MTDLLTFQSGAPRKGNGPPSSATGSPGDLYLDVLNWQWYGPKTPAGEWGEPVPAQGAQGEPGARWRGSYSAAQPYDVNDLVEYGGSVYISLAQQTGANPEEGEWELFASKGDKGNEGPDAYDVAVAEGFSGTRQEWLDSLRGPQGEPGGGVPEGGSVGQVVGKIGAGDYETGWIDPASGYDTDGSTPLKYSAFLAEYGNHQQAFEAAITRLFSAGAYSRQLDLEGARVMLSAPVTLPASFFFGVRTIHNGSIEADTATWSGDYLLQFNADGQNHMLRFINITFEGYEVASWVQWDYGNFYFYLCRGRNSKVHPTPGTSAPAGLHVYGSGHAGLWILGMWMTCAQGNTPIQERTQIGIWCQTGDQKISFCFASYFKHSLVYDSKTLQLSNSHFFQGLGTDNTGTTTGYTASIKLRAGYCAAMISNHYLDNSFIEVSNEAAPEAARIGGLHWYGGHTISQTGDVFGFVTCRNHQSAAVPMEDMTVTGVNFVQRGVATVKPTDAIGNFDSNNAKQITLKDNTYDGNMKREANPATIVQDFPGSGIAKSVSTTGFLPWRCSPNRVISVVAQTTSGAPGGLHVASINRFGQAVAVSSTSAWAGSVIATVTANQNTVGLLEH